MKVISSTILLYLPYKLKKPKMKKISILLLAIFFIGIANINAQNNATTSTVVENKEVKTCTKTGKTCDETCEKKKNLTCCKGKSNSKCSKSNVKKSDEGAQATIIETATTGTLAKEANNETVEKNTCSKSAKKGCCKKNAKNKTAQASSKK